MDRVVREREYICLLDFNGGDGTGLLGGCGRAARDFSVLLAVDPLEEDIEQEVAAKDANRQKNCEGHGGLARANVNASPDKERVETAWERSPERIVRNLLGRFVDGGRRQLEERIAGSVAPMALRI
jgi:hypothetical protein